MRRCLLQRLVWDSILIVLFQALGSSAGLCWHTERSLPCIGYQLLLLIMRDLEWCLRPLGRSRLTFRRLLLLVDFDLREPLINYVLRLHIFVCLFLDWRAQIDLTFVGFRFWAGVDDRGDVRVGVHYHLYELLEVEHLGRIELGLQLDRGHYWLLGISERLKFWVKLA